MGKFVCGASGSLSDSGHGSPPWRCDSFLALAVGAIGAAWICSVRVYMALRFGGRGNEDHLSLRSR
jgi:hypothetical protein